MGNYLVQQRSTVASLVLLFVLVLLSVAGAVAMATYGYTMGMLIVIGILGLACFVVCFARPLFGFQFTIALGFVVAIFERLFYGAIPFDFVVELLTYTTFFGAIYKKHLEGVSFWKGMRHPINFVLLGYLAYLLLETLNPNGSLFGALFSVRKTTQIAVLYLTALSLFQSFQNIRRFVIFWVIISGLCGAYACWQQWVGFPAFELDWIYASEIRVAIYQLDNGSFRKFSTLTDPAAFGILMAVSALFTLVLLLKSPWKRLSYLYAAALLFQLLGLSFSGTRTGIFAVIAGVCFYILMTINNVRTLVFAVFCMLVFAFLMVAPIYGSITLNRFRSAFSFSKDASYEVRNNNRAKIQPYIYAHPMGGGPMTTGINGLRYNPDHYLAGFPSDSGFLRTALEFGWIGLTLVCIVFFTTMQQGVHAFFRERVPLARAFLLAAAVALFSNIVSQYSQVAIGAVPQIYLYYALVALIVTISKLPNNLKTDV